jgi:polyisoprenoid-binding protein YceI
MKLLQMNSIPSRKLEDILTGTRRLLMKSVRMTAWATGLLLAVSAGMASAQIKDLKIDPSHSEADFAIRHLAISTVHGSFHGVSGAVHFDPADVSKMSVDATIDVNTVDTGVAARDGMLKGPNFFDTANFPTMTFKSTSVVKAGDHYDLHGDLTMHGVTKAVTLRMDPPSKAQPGAPGRDGKVQVHYGFTATTTVNRQDFGLKFAGKTPGGDAVLGDDVKVEIDIDAALTM